MLANVAMVLAIGSPYRLAYNYATQRRATRCKDAPRNELSRLCLGVLLTAAGELLSTDEIAGRVIAAKDFDMGDAILCGGSGILDSGIS
jgi:hypothetical protein